MTVATAYISCVLLGLQHGFDVDHVAAIADITNLQRKTSSAIQSGLLYASGHAATVGLLGIAIILVQGSVPRAVSIGMQRVVGITLVLLGLYVLRTLLNGRPALGRGQALLALFDRLRPGTREHRRHEIPGSGSPKSSLGLGVLHGIGAETPTQLSVLLIAASLGGIKSGMLGTSLFAAGMFASNIALTTTTTGIFAVARARSSIFQWLGFCTAGYSLWTGCRLIVF
jgi:high-affinity nickel-transport protein